MTEHDIRINIHANVPLKVLDCVTSTNTIAREWAQSGAPHGASVIAGRQTGGRGRLGRSFFSPEGGLYMSCFLNADGGQALLLTSMAAVAVCRAVDRLAGIHLSIKWVNDLLLGGRKVCGILTEGVMAGNVIKGAVVGIGLNIRPETFPPDIADTAVSLFSGEPAVSAAEIAASVIDELLRGAEGLKTRAHMPEYRMRCTTLDREISFKEKGLWFHGKAVGIDDDGGLVVDTHNGIKVLNTGEITVR